MFPFIKRPPRISRLWLDLGDPGVFVSPAGPLERWQDHGLGLLRTILLQHGIKTDLFSLRSIKSWDQLPRKLAGYDVLIMNVRSYTFPFAFKAAKTFKQINPSGIVITGGMHAAVAPDEMASIEEFDRICEGAGEQVIVDLVRDPKAFPRVLSGAPSKSMADWPMVDRRLWPNPRLRGYPWPLEPECGWGPGPLATVITSRVCPWKCAFCNEFSYIPDMGRRPVDMVIDELNYLDRTYGPLGSVVIHDSMFFQQPHWLEEWLEKYPRRAKRRWPYWAAARADTVRKWPELFEALVKESNWHTISIGFESGSDRVLKILNKECSVADNYFTIDLLNQIGDEYVRQGKNPPKFWANIMLGIPGESREDAFETMRMLRHMRFVIPSISFYAPYPGSALGYQLMSEGKSLMTKDNYHRYPHDEKVKGVDYPFYRELLAGTHDDQVGRSLVPEERRAKGISGETANSFSNPHSFYVFDMCNGRQKLAYGDSPETALETLRLRLSDEEMALIIRDRYRRIWQKDLLREIGNLG